MSSTRLLVRLVQECLRYPVRLGVAVASLLALGAAQLALPWVVKRWVEGPLVAGAAEIGPWVAAAILLAGLIALLLFASRMLLASVNQRVLERLRSEAVTRLLRLEPARLHPFPTGDLMSRVFQDAGLLSGFAENVLKRLLGDGTLAAGAVVMMFLLDPRLAAVACLLAPLIGLLLAALGSVIRRWGAAAQRGMGELGGTLQEQLQGLTTVKGYQAEAFEAERFARQNASYRERILVVERWSALLIASVFLLAALGFVAAVAYGSRRVAAGRITAGALLAFCLYAGQTIEPLRRLAEMHGLLQRSLAAAERLFLLLDLPLDEPAEPDQAPVAEPRRGRDHLQGPGAAAVSFAEVRFAYQAGQRVLDGFTLEVAAGERTAIVASSGGGKSTLASLLVRFHDPEAGRILLAGTDLREIPRSRLRRLVRVVEQRPFLFSGPLLDNVRYGSWDAPQAAVEEALRLAGMAAWVAADPRGLDAPLGEAGRDLSGGQRQRVALARAILSDPALLVLDEATSALDSEAEGQILADLEAWLGRRTVLVLAHRLSTIRRVERVVLLAEGRVADQGTLADLVRRSAPFRTLFAEQLDGAGAAGSDRP